MSKKYVIGIDGGVNGALTVLTDKGIVEQTVMPTVTGNKGRSEYDCRALVEFLSKYADKDVMVVLEKAQYTPALGGISSFSFGKSFGMMIGMLEALRMPYMLVAARSWQAIMFRDMSYTDSKQASALVAQRLFPHHDFRATERSKKVHDGKTDSTLIALYGQRNAYVG